jgi:hypothetical protein
MELLRSLLEASGAINISFAVNGVTFCELIIAFYFFEQVYSFAIENSIDRFHFVDMVIQNTAKWMIRIWVVTCLCFHWPDLLGCKIGQYRVESEGIFHIYCGIFPANRKLLHRIKSEQHETH